MAHETDYLAGPLSLAAGMPLRVAVYSKISLAIHSGHLKPGSVLPNEGDISATLGVSRTVIREAMLLLEEDGLVKTKRGVGRFVADSIPVAGLERIQSMEDLLSDDGIPPRLLRLRHDWQDASTWVAENLAVEFGTQVWITETLFLDSTGPVGVSQEYINAAPSDVDGLSSLSAPATLLSILLGRGGAVDAARVDVAIAPAGETRAGQLGVGIDDPLLVLTHHGFSDGVAVYLGKCSIVPSRARFVVNQSF